MPVMAPPCGIHVAARPVVGWVSAFEPLIRGGMSLIRSREYLFVVRFLPSDPDGARENPSKHLKSGALVMDPIGDHLC